MERRSMIPITVPAALYLLSGMTIAFSGMLAVQALLGTLPEDSLRAASVPVAHFTHMASGVLFGLIGPLQFGRVLARRYGRLHRVMGRVFVAAGAVLSLSGLSLLWHFPDVTGVIVTGGRCVFGLALGVALVMAMLAIRKRDIARHRDWMIRAYATGIGATLVSIVFLPIYIATGVPPTGIIADVSFIGSWFVCVVFAEILVRRIRRKGAVA